MPSSNISVQRAWTLGMFAKCPRPGHVKSRLAANTTAEWAAQAAQAFLQDLAARFARVPVHRVVVYSPADAAGDFAALVGDQFSLQPQSEGDLGQRLIHFLRGQFQAIAERVVLVGTDSPTLPVTFVEQAFEMLSDADVVLGPATDGGYYLIGCRRCEPRLFQGVNWGGERVLLETSGRVRELGLRLALLPPWYDVDTIEDWWMLRGHLAAMRLAGIDPEVPHTTKMEYTDLPLDGGKNLVNM